MGFFDRFKKASKPARPEALSVSAAAGEVLAPVNGDAIELAKVSDPVFSGGVMGKGCGIKPSGETVYAPVAGELAAIGAPNLHAIAIKGDDGAEILIHVGVDTVEMKGDGFTAFAKQGDHVEAGEALLTFSDDKIKKAGYDDVVVMAITNTDDLKSVDQIKTGTVQAGEAVLTYKK